LSTATSGTIRLLTTGFVMTNDRSQHTSRARSCNAVYPRWRPLDSSRAGPTCSSISNRGRTINPIISALMAIFDISLLAIWYRDVRLWLFRSLHSRSGSER